MAANIHLFYREKWGFVSLVIHSLGQRIVTSLLGGVALLYAHEPPQREAPPREPQMVNLNVVALDNKGQPVTDLKRDDFRIVDNGKPQSIAFFRHRDNSLGVIPTLARNEYSNRGGSNVPRATLILFDLLNERFATRGVTANELIHDLGSLESADYVYLYCLTLDGRVVPIHGLPGPEARPAPPGAEPWTRQIKPLLDGAMKAVAQVRPVDDLDPVYRVQVTYNALDIVAAQLSRVPGRKSIVWLTDGVPLVVGPNRTFNGEPIDFTPLMRRMSEAFDRYGVSIYSVRRVMLGSPDGMGGPKATGMDSLDTLDQFAELTGGRPDAGKDIGAAIRQSIIDMRTSYEIGYYPPQQNWDSKFHKLRVTCTRKGVRIQAKTGYYAWEDAPGSRSEQAIQAATATAFDAAEIGLRASATRDYKGGGLVHFEAHIDARDVALVHENETYNGELRIAIIGYDSDVSRQGPLVPLDLHLTAPERDKLLQEGVPYSQDIVLKSEINKLRLIVYDRNSNAVGSVTVPVPEAMPGK
jgi:VWFA-related protein